MDKRPAVQTRPYTDADHAAIVELLVAAFNDDPLFLMMAPNPARRRRLSSAIFAAEVTGRSQHGEVSVAVEDGDSGRPQILGAALWASPPDCEVAGAALRPHVASIVWNMRWQIPTTLRGMGRVEKLHRAAHRDPERADHSYLAVLGVAPERQGTGAGSALVAEGLRKADADAKGTYLETSTRSNVSWYARQGFQECEHLVMPDGKTDVWTMWRAPT